ncbi:26S proteasome non-ATPase regulatory subunit 5 [Pseudolycoriella hygida]|uniref:26S proteasome non-ATPase regulatory subunit 5 n=1 Tax=Pseudolycoriella hygida TaxID=35572 RepID=A0A9Q0MQY1_9DIPT|nr:26S proteasome non-ATPase regulatory subunit 5 [Pseudolycoriella hygida]
MSEEWCRQQLMNLQIKDRRLDTLNEIRNHLTKLPANEVASVSSNFLTLPELLDCVEDNQEKNEQSNLACDILSLCMSNLDLSDTSKNFDYLERCLDHQNDSVKVLGLNEVDRISKQFPNQTFSQNVIISVIKCLENPQERVGAVAAKILPAILPKVLSDHSVHSNLNRLLTCSDLVRCRVYDSSTAIAKQSQGNLECVAYILDRLCTNLNSDDVLLELIVLEFLSDLAQTDHGWLYLENKGIFKSIADKLDTMETNPLKNLLFPGYVKFFGNVALKQPMKVLQGFPSFVNALMDLLLESIVSDADGTTLPVVFDTLAQLGFSDQGILLLEDLYSVKMIQTLSAIGKSIHNLPTRLQIRALNCLEILFQSDFQNNRVNSITNQWFIALTGKAGMNFILNYCRNPFPDIKLAALTLLKVLVMPFWGKIELQKTAGFIEFLTDRNVEFNKDAIHEKYRIIEILSEATNVFDRDALGQLKKYVQQGAFYVEGIMDVVAEGRS